MKTSVYRLEGTDLPCGKRMALVTDLHSQDPQKLLCDLQRLSPDYILMAGDILEALDGSCDGINREAFESLSGAASIAPTFYSTGNHEDGGVHSGRRKWREEHCKERIYTEENLRKIRESGVYFLLDSYVVVDGIAFGGLASGLILEGSRPNLEFLSDFAKTDEPKVLLCHHPEYYEPYIKQYPISLIVSGHAHGGQWRFFGRGVYAPGQGIFPKYTSGIHDGRFVISRGLKKTVIPPRIFNSRQIVIIET